MSRIVATALLSFWIIRAWAEDGFVETAEKAVFSRRLANTTNSNTSQQERCKIAAKERDECDGSCPSDLFVAIFPDSNGNTCSSGSTSFWKRFEDFPGIGFFYEQAWKFKIFGSALPFVTFTAHAQGAVTARGLCRHIIGLQPTVKYCQVQTPAFDITPKLGDMILPKRTMAMCLVWQPSLNPTVSVSFTGIGFSSFAPWSIEFYGGMISLNGCAEMKMENYMDTKGVIQKGGISNIDAGAHVSLLWGIKTPLFELGVKTSTEVAISLDPNGDGTYVSPAQVITSMFRQSCIQGASKARDWRVIIQAKQEMGLGIGKVFAIKFVNVYAQIILDSSAEGTNAYISFGVRSVSSLASIFSPEYKWYVQDSGVEAQICDQLSKVTSIPKCHNPFCKDDFSLFRKKDAANVFISAGSSGVATQISFWDGYSATIKRVENGWEMCLNNKCHARRCFFDSDCSKAGYACYNQCSTGNALCKPNFQCQRVLTGCLCGLVGFREYKDKAWTKESCAKDKCTVHELTHATAHKECKGRGGKNHCVALSVPDTKPKQFCDGPQNITSSSGGRRLFADNGLFADTCFPSRETLSTCGNGTCPASLGSAECVEGTCLCSAGHCPTRDGTKCVATGRQFQEAKAGKLVDFVPPWSLEQHPSETGDNSVGRSLAAFSKLKASCHCGKTTTTTTIRPAAVVVERCPSPPPARSSVGAKITVGELSLGMDDAAKFAAHAKAKSVLASALQVAIQETTPEVVFFDYITINAMTPERRLTDIWRRLAGNLLVSYSVKFPYETDVAITESLISEATLRDEVNRGTSANGIGASVTTVTIRKPFTYVEARAVKAVDTNSDGLDGGTMSGILIGSAAFALISSFAGFCYCQKRQKRKRKDKKLAKKDEEEMNALATAPVYGNAAPDAGIKGNVYGNAAPGHGQQPVYMYAQEPQMVPYGQQVNGQKPGVQGCYPGYAAQPNSAPQPGIAPPPFAGQHPGYAAQPSPYGQMPGSGPPAGIGQPPGYPPQTNPAQAYGQQPGAGAQPGPSFADMGYAPQPMVGAGAQPGPRFADMGYAPQPMVGAVAQAGPSFADMGYAPQPMGGNGQQTGFTQAVDDGELAAFARGKAQAQQAAAAYGQAPAGRGSDSSAQWHSGGDPTQWNANLQPDPNAHIVCHGHYSASARE